MGENYLEEEIFILEFYHHYRTNLF